MNNEIPTISGIKVIIQYNRVCRFVLFKVILSFFDQYLKYNNSISCRNILYYYDLNNCTTVFVDKFENFGKTGYYLFHTTFGYEFCVKKLTVKYLSE